MPHTCEGVSRADNGASGTSEAGSVIAIRCALWLLGESSSKGRPLRVSLARNFLDPGDQFVDRLLDRDLLADHAIHRLGPDVLVVQNRELPILGEVEGHRASHKLVIDGLAMAVSLPERAALAFGRHRKPAA